MPSLRHTLLKHACVTVSGNKHLARYLLECVLRTRSEKCLLWRDMRMNFSFVSYVPVTGNEGACCREGHNGAYYSEALAFADEFGSVLNVGAQLLADIRGSLARKIHDAAA